MLLVLDCGVAFASVLSMSGISIIFFMHRAAAVIVAWFGGRTSKHHNEVVYLNAYIIMQFLQYGYDSQT
jgi:hypothetical protein